MPHLSERSLPGRRRLQVYIPPPQVVLKSPQHTVRRNRQSLLASSNVTRPVYATSPYSNSSTLPPILLHSRNFTTCSLRSYPKPPPRDRVHRTKMGNSEPSSEELRECGTSKNHPTVRYWSRKPAHQVFGKDFGSVLSTSLQIGHPSARPGAWLVSLGAIPLPVYRLFCLNSRP